MKDGEKMQRRSEGWKKERKEKRKEGWAEWREGGKEGELEGGIRKERVKIKERKVFIEDKKDRKYLNKVRIFINFKDFGSNNVSIKQKILNLKLLAFLSLNLRL